jgi:hypothetical protein
LEGSSVIFRLNPNGTLDTMFGSGGTVTVRLGSIGASVGGLVVQTDGKIVASVMGVFVSEVTSLALAQPQNWMTLVHLRLLRPHRIVADRVLVPDAVSDGVRLLHVLSDELAVDKTRHRDGDLA